MRTSEALRRLAEVTASQWGMVTTAQAGTLEVSRLTLSRLTDAGHLERLAHGVYRDAGVPSHEFEDLRAAWLSTEPKLRAEERLRELTDDVVVASSSAALLHGVGDLWANRHEFVTSKRRQTQRPEVRYRQRGLEGRDITLVEGLPVMTLERTLADLLDDIGEVSLVADALGMAVKTGSLDLDRLRDLFGPLAERNGFRRRDGNAVLERLLEIAGLDVDSVARRFSADPVLSARIIDNYLKTISRTFEMPDTSRFIQQINQHIPEVTAGHVKRILELIRPQLALDEQAWRMLSEINARNLSETSSEILSPTVMANISKQWAQSQAALSASATVESSIDKKSVAKE